MNPSLELAETLDVFFTSIPHVNLKVQSSSYLLGERSAIFH